jgi:hypothetical protein
MNNLLHGEPRMRLNRQERQENERMEPQIDADGGEGENH